MAIHSKWRLSVGLSLAMCLPSVFAFAAETQPSTQFTTVTFDIAEIMADPANNQAGMQREETLQKAIDGATTPLDQATAHLAMANWLLAVPTARPATRLLMGYPTPADSAKLAESAQTAKTNLEIARTLLKPEALEAKERRRTLRSAATTLEAFANLFAAIGSSPPNGTCPPCSEAAVELAATREAEDVNVAAAALLWQSLGWELAGRRERSLTSLPNALEKPEHLPYDFMSRLLRCRLLAASEQKEAAVALTIRIRALCDKWFPRQEGEAIEEKRRLTDVLRYQFLREWMAEINTENDAAVQKLQAMLDETRKNMISAENASVIYFMEASIPLIVEPPKPNLRLSTLPAATAPIPTENEKKAAAENNTTNPASE